MYAGFCGTADCGMRTYTVRIMKSKKADFRKLEKYCPSCRKRTAVKLKEEKHSS